jgi:hypothetical protein
MFIAIFITGIFGLLSCEKPSSTPAAATIYTLQCNVNGTFTSALSPIYLNLDISWFNIKNPLTMHTNTGQNIATNGSYVAFTYTDDTIQYLHSYPGYNHGFTFAQLNLDQLYDTTGFVIKVFSAKSYRIKGDSTYQIKIWPDTFTVSAPPNAGPVFATAIGYNSAMTGFTDSTTVGSMTLSQYDLINKVATGTFNFVNYGKTVNNVIPSISISNGQFNSLPLEVY